ncbi:PTS sugar transporter subunit IIB [Weizmannia coagulans]|jgi:PTS system galactitol-specific IIB component|uniref:PTS galactitol transporter subunit IIB n=2 Tax=Heyndrickxia TaxID=2837504 RepID=A0A0C5CCG4_HEYCO|nr:MULTISPECIES: PTS sugar transporter subunit IIB [Heyndrickxia]NWN95437.1 PTS sugar transporter subunit IIB [Bacillus sp. (in: firmicutes)]AJO24379.1 PTS galactitol transporter subunit IIB [Heyndrickxia coagulans]AKN54157.1 PTS system, galactitol-specific IIB component [Heyndrickxia coagulans]APB38251.1 PTS galactitol transporter subunit IIB [Heyndrickxia coagulans]ATW84221.1 PTS galactitol transporter subunit IIB [Heyndrickxia coagulans]
MKRVIVACGSGVATSQTVASKVKRILQEKKISAEVEAVDIKSLDRHVKNCDVYIAITKPKTDYGVPTLNGIAFLTGMGMDKEVEKLVEALK